MGEIYIPVKEVASQLGYRTFRSVYRWCAKHDVAIVGYAGTRKKYVISREFETARLSALVAHLKIRFGEAKWRGALQAYLSGDVLSLVTVQQVSSFPGNLTRTSQGFAQEFLSELKNALKNAKSTHVIPDIP